MDIQKIIERAGPLIEQAGPLLDKAAAVISPKWGAQRAFSRFRLSAFTDMGDNGYVTPGSRRKSMKGMTATANSPDSDTITKLSGMRALSRDLFMNGGLAAAILQRHQTLSIGSGLQVQSMVDREFLGLTPEQAERYDREFEREFDLWAESPNSDFEGISCFGDNQALGYLNMLVSGDFFWMPVWRPAPEKDFPYELCIKLIDADLVRDPFIDGVSTTKDIQGGVEKDGGRVVAYHVWDCYEYEQWTGGKAGKATRVPVYDKSGRQQIFHVFDPKRISQRRGVPLLAPVADSLKQLDRLTQAQLMKSLVASFFTAFIRDQSGMGATLAPALTPEETVTGGGTYGPGQAETGERNDEDGNDLEMGHGNIVYLDDKKDVTIANPGTTDENFKEFFEAQAMVACAGGNIPVEQALMHYTTSFTAARAAGNDVWKHRLRDRAIINRKMNQRVYLEQQQEALLKGRVQAPKYFDDYSYRRAWSRTSWVGAGQGHMNPVQEVKASVIKLNNNLSTHEAEFQKDEGGRWDSMVERRAQEQRHLENSGLVGTPDPNELIGPDGQKDKKEEDETPKTV